MKLTTIYAQNTFDYKYLLSRIYPYLKPYKLYIICSFALAIPLGLLDGVIAFTLKPYMDYVIGKQDCILNLFGSQTIISWQSFTIIVPVAILLFAALQAILRFVNDYLSVWISRKITIDVKTDLFHRLVYMEPQFFDKNSSGIIISRYINDPNMASSGIIDRLKELTTCIFGTFGPIIVILYCSWKLALIGVLTFCITFIPVVFLRKKIEDVSNKITVINGKITTNVNETYQGNKIVTSYELQKRQEKHFKDKINEAFRIEMDLTKKISMLSPIMYFIAAFAIAVVIGYATHLINTNQMSVGSFTSFAASLLLLYTPVKILGGILAGLQNTFAALNRVFELFDINPKIIDKKNAKTMQGLNESIIFENVFFEYINDRPVLNDISFKVNKNETIAIVGNSGGGKSTLVNLLPRFYDIKSGSIKFDGVDLREFSLKSLRQNISVVFQDNFLFLGTIRENIMLGKPDATEEELNKAVEYAHLQEFISDLPKGLDTNLGERGLTFSGGQRQRIAIARAMIKNSPIVVLDEATSALDNKSEAIVQKALNNLIKNKTVFVIAHRLSTIQNANRIAVINDGELVELGSHDELIKLENGFYKKLYELQFKKQSLK